MVTVVVTGHSSRRSTPPRWTPTGNGLQRGQFCWPPLGKTVDRQRAATWPPLGRISWPPTIDARDSFVKVRKSLGQKRKEISAEQIADITRLYGAFEEGPRIKIFPNESFGFLRITVERPLRLRWEVGASPRWPVRWLRRAWLWSDRWQRVRPAGVSWNSRW